MGRSSPLGHVFSSAHLIPERAPGRTIAAVGLVLALVYTSALVWLPRSDGRMIAGDAVHYYVYLRSAVVDRDLHFLNDYVGLATGIPDAGHDGPEWLAERTSTGHIRNVMSVGPALAWAPLFLVVTGGVWMGRLVGFDWPLDGLWWPYQASVSYSGIAAATLAAYLAYLLCARVASRRAAIWATLTMWLGSHALYYSLVAPQYSHAVSMCASGLFFTYWLRTYGQTRIVRFIIVGALGGLTALVRWQDVLVLAAPAIEVVFSIVAGRTVAAQATGEATTAVGHRERATTDANRPGLSVPEASARLIACGAGAALAFSPQLLAWQVIFGQPLLVPQGSGFMRWTSPALVEVLFSTFRGLFTWTPVVVLGVVGLARWTRANRAQGLAMGVVLVAGWYANAAVVDWWAGEAFGARRFLGDFPVFALGLAVMLDTATAAWSSKRLAALSALVVVLNGLLLLQYQAFMHGLRAIVPYPDDAYGLFVARFIVPFSLVRQWWPW